MNSRESVRSMLTFDRTPENKGWTTIIKLTSYDNGILNINGQAIGNQFPETHRWLAAMRIAVQIIEEFEVQCTRNPVSSEIVPA